jgi:Carboxypeptidase regulatory-like domain/TonB dependent receptor-like, beta-barrel/TonB-dependent Receptor Plug Domain
MRALKVFLLAAVSLASAAAVVAAVVGSVRGIVHDPQHRPIPGAEVKLDAVNSSWSQSTKSNDNGEFAFPAVPVGVYNVTISASKFQTQAQNVAVMVNASPILHFVLQIAAVSATATVTAEAESTAAETATPMTLVNRAEINQTPGADQTNSLQMITDFVPGSYMTHDMLHIRGGHQVSWLIDGVPIPNLNIAVNLGPQVDPKDIDYVDVMRGSYSSEYGDRTYGIFDVVPKNGFEMNNEGQLVASFGNFYQTDDQLSFGGHSEKLAYYASLDGNRSNLGLETPISQVYHDAASGVGGFGSIIYNAGPQDQFRIVGSLRRDYYQVPYDPNPDDYENQQWPTSGLRDNEVEADGYSLFSWIHTFSPNTVLTVSPFYHYNSAGYHSPSNDYPVATTAIFSSNYGGGQAILNFHLPKNDAQAGVYAFGANQNENFGLIFNDNSNNSIRETNNVPGTDIAAFLSDKFTVNSWLTLIGGVRATHFSGGITENTTYPRIGGTLRIPKINWVFRAFWGKFYQPPPLIALSGPLLSYLATLTNTGVEETSFVPLLGEKDEEHQFGVTIPYRGWALDIDNFETRGVNFLDHNNIGESSIFIPVTIAESRIRGTEVTVRSPRVWRIADIHLAYSNQTAQAAGEFTGGLIVPGDPPDWGALDHDQRNTLNFGFNADLPWRSYLASNLYYGSGFSNGDAGFPGSPYQAAYLPGHTTVDVSLGKDFGEKYSVSVTALNIGDRHLLIDNSLTFGGFHYNNPREVYVQFRYRFHY